MYPRTNTGGLDSLSPVIEVIRNSFVDGSLGFLGSSEACGSSEGSSGFVGEVMSALVYLLHLAHSVPCV